MILTSFANFFYAYYFHWRTSYTGFNNDCLDIFMIFIQYLD